MANLNDEFYREQILRLRALARDADPFIKQRLLDLADKYDARIGRKPRGPLPLPTVTGQKHADHKHSGGDPR
jgi:hypothetical protein